MECKDLVLMLLSKCRLLAIENGKLRLEPANGKPVPDEWLALNQNRIIKEILRRTGADAFVFKYYTTGNYVKGLRGSGVTLQFSNFLTDADAYVIFNADIKRTRTTKNGDKGSPLPKGKFRVEKGSHFVKFWRATGLPMPTRLSVFHDYMGNLKPFLFTGDYQDDERMNAETVRPVNITHAQLIAAFSDLNMHDNCQTTSRQHPDNCQTRVPDKEIKNPLTQQGFQVISNAGKNKYGLSLQGNADIRRNFIPLKKPKRPVEQTDEEWLADYGAD